MPTLSKRLEVIYSELLPAKTFADVGCDHGYIAEAMLFSGKCERVIISDISKSSLKKAEDLLKEKYGERVVSVVADGFDGLPYFDEALIAGMGGEEIVKIVSGAKFLPETLAVQPMKNADKVRKVLIKSGYKLIKDYIFKAEGKFYEFVLAVKGEEERPYSDLEIAYGRGNLAYKSEDFKEYISIKRSVLLGATKGVSKEKAEEIQRKIKELDGII